MREEGPHGIHIGVEDNFLVSHVARSQLRGMATERPRQSRERLQQEIHATIADSTRAGQIASRFESLDSGWTFPHRDDEELDVLLTTG